MQSLEKQFGITQEKEMHSYSTKQTLLVVILFYIKIQRKKGDLSIFIYSKQYYLNGKILKLT